MTDSLDQLRALEKDWDSYGALPIAERALTIARIIRDHAPAISPMSNGGVMLEWFAEGWEISLEISPEHKARAEADVYFEEISGDD